MSVTILKILLNAKYNLNSDYGFQKKLGLEQFNNVIILLENNKKLHDVFDDNELSEFKKNQAYK